MKGEFFRPCPKCGKICNAELDMCEICSGKIAKPEPPKPIIPVVTPVVEPIVEEVAPIVEEQVATEEVIEEVATEENIVEETINEEKQEEVVVPVIETKAPKGKGTKGLYALVAVLMLVIVALVVVIMQDGQPTVAVGNTTLPSNTTSTTSAQETETTTEITEGTTVDNAGETLAPVTITKKAQSSNKETTTKKNTSSTKETTKETTKEHTTKESPASKKESFKPKVIYSNPLVVDNSHLYQGSVIKAEYISYSVRDVSEYTGTAQIDIIFRLTEKSEQAYMNLWFFDYDITFYDENDNFVGSYTIAEDVSSKSVGSTFIASRCLVPLETAKIVF